MEVRNIFFRHKEPIYTNPGSTVAYDYVESLNERGEPILVGAGMTDLVELHNADRDSVDLHLIIKRYQQGDINALEQRSNAFYDDITQMPQDAIEAQNRALAARRIFEALPLDVKSKFGNNATVWLNDISAGKKDALETLGVTFKERSAAVAKSSEGVTESES